MHIDVKLGARGVAVLHCLQRVAFLQGLSSDEEVKPEEIQIISCTARMGFAERWQHTLQLWPYIIPLIVVYFAEYSMQVCNSYSNSKTPFLGLGRH